MKNTQRQLSQADPMNHVALPALPDAAVKALAQEIVMHEQSSPSPIEQPDEVHVRSPRRRRRRLIVGLLAGLIVVPTTAAAVVGGMHSGFFEPQPPKGLSSMAEPGEEWLKGWDPEIVSLVQDLTTEFPLPAGVTYGPFSNAFQCPWNGSEWCNGPNSPGLWPTTPDASGIRTSSKATRPSGPQTRRPSMPCPAGSTGASRPMTPLVATGVLKISIPSPRRPESARRR